MRYVSSVLSAFIITSLLVSQTAFGIVRLTPAVLVVSDGPTYNFGNVTVGAVQNYAFTVTNSGQASAKLMVATSPTSPFVFKGGTYPGSGGNCGKTLNGGGKACRIVLSFSPTATGTFTGSFGIQYNDRYNTQTVSRAVTGTAITPAVLTFSDGAAYNFGSVTNGTSKLHTFTVTNGGQTTATQLITSSLGQGFSFEGGYPGTGGTCSVTLSAGASCGLVMTYTPTKRATDSSTLKLNYRSGSTLTSVSIALTGRGRGTAANITSITPSHGPISGGTPVVILGANFGRPFTVTIGGTSCASAVFVSSTQINCVTGAHAAGPNDVVFTDTLTDTFNNGYTYDPAPIVTSIDPLVGPNSGGTVISITGTNFQSGATVSIGGSACQSVVFTSDGFLQCTTPAHPTQTVSITVTNPDTQTGSLNSIFSFQGVWTWKNGSSAADPITAGAPGGRDSASSWTTTSNDFWLFGGWGWDTAGKAGQLNDLWKFNGTTWTKMSGSNLVGQQGAYGTQGVADPANVPGGRINALTWRDSHNNLWLFGGFGYDSNHANGNLNDLWKFDGTNWTWVSGAKVRNQRGTSTMPGARVLASQWIDSHDNLWLFGGYGYDSAGLQGELNDVWVFNGASWTWMGGSNLRNQNASYGTMGVTLSSNMPSSRDSAAGWVDSSGNYWMFGGSGYDSTGTVGYLNDMWKFDGTNWTWVSGFTTANPLSVFGTEGVASSSNIPGGRSSGISWLDSSNTLWLFGGYGLDASGFEGGMNDLWKFDGTNWTWVTGSQVSDVAGIYGAQGTPALGNSPGTREYSSAWIDTSNRLWLFGGFGMDSTGVQGDLNDLWVYDR